MMMRSLDVLVTATIVMTTMSMTKDKRARGLDEQSDASYGNGFHVVDRLRHNESFDGR
jgi:hypothetical protein